jgi:ABC-type amino acid transport substrate-binding protein
MRYLALVLILLAAARASGAQGVAPKEATLAIGEQPPLFSPSGGIVDMVVVKSLAAGGYNAALEWLPIGRMLVLLQQDSLDRYVSASNAPGQQNAHLEFLEARGVFFYKKARFPELRADSLEDLAGKRVATVLNSPNTPVFQKAGMIVDEGPFETLFTKLDIGRVDFTATADVGGIIRLKQLFPGRESEFAFTELSYSTIRAGLYAKDDPALLLAARKGFELIRADGSLDKMLKDFFGLENWKRVRIVF